MTKVAGNEEAPAPEEPAEEAKEEGAEEEKKEGSDAEAEEEEEEEEEDAEEQEQPENEELYSKYMNLCDTNEMLLVRGGTMLIARSYGYVNVFKLDGEKATCVKIITMKGYHDIVGVAASPDDEDVLIVSYGKYTSKGRLVVVQEYNLKDKSWNTVRKMRDGYSHRLSFNGKFV